MPGRKNPYHPVAKLTGAAASFWDEPYAHPTIFFSANLMPRKSPHWPLG